MTPGHVLPRAVVAAIALLLPLAPSIAQDPDPDAVARWYQTRGRHVLLDDALLYTVRRHQDEALVKEWLAEKRGAMVPLTELWTVSLSTLERELLATFLENAEVVGLEEQDGRPVAIVRCRSIGEWIGQRAIPMGVLAMPWLERRTFRCDLRTAAAQRVADVPRKVRGHYSEIGPDGRTEVCNGEGPDEQSGFWVVDRRTGDARLLLEGGFRQGAHLDGAGARIVAALAQGYGRDAEIAVIDVETGEVTELGLRGAGPIWSPDDSQIAYSANARGGTWVRGVPANGHLFIADADGTNAFELTPPDRPGFNPRWSPDGDWIAYLSLAPEPDEDDRRHGHLLRVVNTVDPDRNFLVTESCDDDFFWTADSEGLIALGSRGTLYRIRENDKVVALSLGTTAPESVLPEDAAAAIGAASDVVRKATADYRAGKEALDRLELEAGREQLNSAADAFGSLRQRFPAARLVQADLDVFAEHIRGLATATDDEVKAQVARLRLYKVYDLLRRFRKTEKRLPEDLETVAKWRLDNAGTDKYRDYLEKEMPAWLRDPDAPEGERISWQYTPPGDARPAVLVTNPRRPGLRIILNEEDQLRVETGETE